MIRKERTKLRRISYSMKATNERERARERERLQQTAYSINGPNERERDREREITTKCLFHEGSKREERERHFITFSI